MPCCGAIYSWFLSAGNVMLMHRYVWKIHQPTSAAWLALLDEDSYKESRSLRATVTSFGAVRRTVPLAMVDGGSLWLRCT